MPNPRQPGEILPHPNIGVVFHVTKFEKPNERGVAHGFEETGWKDFLEGDYKLIVAKGIQNVKIHENAKENGDAGVARHIEARPGEEYKMTARVRVKKKKGGFKARLNMAARKREGPQVGDREFNTSVEEETDKVVEQSVKGVMPPETEQLTVRVKFHTFKPGEAGEGEIHSVKLERLR